MDNDSSKLDASKLSGSPKKVLLLVKDSVRPYVQEHLGEYLAQSAHVEVAYPGEGRSIDELIQSDYDVSIVDPLAYTSVFKMKDLVSRVKQHTRQALILVKRNVLRPGLEETLDYDVAHDSPVKPRQLAETVRSILYPGSEQSGNGPVYRRTG